jgi:hypothetical protein
MRVRFRSCSPDNFFPIYDGNEIVEALYVHRRRTSVLQMQYPDLADQIHEDSAMLLTQVTGSDLARYSASGQTTVIDWFSADGGFARLMGDAFIGPLPLDYGFGAIPFIEFPCYPIDNEQEPRNALEQLVELNQYLDQLLSQRADVLRKYSNPPILDEDTGQAPEAIKRAVASDGSVIPMKRGGNLRLLNWEGTPADFDTQYQNVMDTLFDLAGKPRAAFGQTVTNQSGVVTNLNLTPTLQSNETHETVWGLKLQKLNEYILRLWERFSPAELIQLSGYRPGLISGQAIFFKVLDPGPGDRGLVREPDQVAQCDPHRRPGLRAEPAGPAHVPASCYQPLYVPGEHGRRGCRGGARPDRAPTRGPAAQPGWAPVDDRRGDHASEFC